MSTVTGRAPAGAAPEPDPAPGPGRLRGDLLAVAGAAALVAAACLGGWALVRRGVPVLVDWPPLLADWLPHVGPGTVPALAVAVGVALWGPAVVERLAWRWVPPVAYLGALAWTLCLALVDGWTRGIAGRLETETEYLHEVARTPSIQRFVAGFADRIAGTTPGTLYTHPSGHPPAATVFYVGLERLGLGGGDWAGGITLALGASAVAAATITLGVLAGRDTARRYVPFGVLFPGAVWVGVSADGLFAAVFAWGVALLALGATRRGAAGHAASLIGGLALGLSLYLSYGLAAAGLVPVAVAVVTRRIGPLLVGGLGVALVVAAFTAAGFWWVDGYQQVSLRYYQPGEYGVLRPYGYWVWADLAALALALGPAVVAGLRRLVRWPLAAPRAVLALALAAAIGIAVADLSGLSKAEVERIWLPFDVWLVTATVLLPRPAVRWWLLAQAGLALAVNHLLLTTW